MNDVPYERCLILSPSLKVWLTEPKVQIVTFKMSVCISFDKDAKTKQLVPPFADDKHFHFQKLQVHLPLGRPYHSTPGCGYAERRFEIKTKHY